MECRVCTAQPSVREAVEQRIAEGAGYRVVAAESGFSKTAIFRHCKRHIARRVLKQSREAKDAARHSRFITQWPDGSLTIQKDGQPILRSKLLATDLIIAIHFTQGVVGNPIALTLVPPGATIEELEAFFRNRSRKAPEPRQDDLPVPLPLAAEKLLQESEEPQSQQTGEATGPDCEHDFKSPSAGVRRL